MIDLELLNKKRYLLRVIIKKQFKYKRLQQKQLTYNITLLTKSINIKYKMTNKYQISATILSPQRYIEIKKVVNNTLNNQSQLTYTSMVNCIAQLYNNRNQHANILNKLQNFLKYTDCLQTKTTHKLVNGASLDYQKSIDLAAKKFQELSQNTMKKQPYVGGQRIQTIINFLAELNYGEIDQQSVKQNLQFIKNSEHLQTLEKDTLEAAFNRMLNYQISRRKIQGHPETTLNQIKKFSNFASNSKNYQQELKRQFQRMLRPAKQIMTPLFAQMMRLKSFHRGLIQKVLDPKTKVRLFKQNTQTAVYYEARQSSIEGMIQEAKSYKVQNERIKVVLASLVKMTNCSLKQLTNQQYQKQRKLQISQVKQDQVIKNLFTIFDHMLATKSSSPLKNAYQDPLGVNRQKSESNKYQKIIQQLQKQIKVKSNQLQQAVEINNQLDKGLEQCQAKVEEKMQQIKRIEQKLKQTQNKYRTLQTDYRAKTNQFVSAGSNRVQVELRKKCLQLEQNLTNITSQNNYLAQQCFKLQESALQKEEKIKNLETQLKKLQLSQESTATKDDKIRQLQAKLKLKQNSNEKDNDKQKAKLRKNLSDTQQKVDELRQELSAAKIKIQDLEKQSRQVISKGNAENGRQISNNDSIVVALRQNDRINKETIQKYKKQNIRLTTDLRLIKEKLQQMTNKYQELKKQSEENSINLNKLKSIEEQLIQMESNYNDLNNLYTKLKEELDAEKGKSGNNLKNGQQRGNTVDDLKSQLKQKQLQVKRYTQKFLKQTEQRDQQLLLLKSQIEQNNRQLQKLRDSSDSSQLSKKNVELLKEVEALSKENHELKINLQRKEREILQIKIQRI